MRAALVLLLVPSLAPASFEHPAPGEVALRDVPNTGRKWQEGRAVIDAPLPMVRNWLFDAAHWPGRFHDAASVEVLSRSADEIRVRMRSRLAGRDLLLDIRLTPTAIESTGEGRNVDVAGRIFLTPAGPGRTDVIMQTSAHVRGLAGVFAPERTIRDRSRRKLLSDLSDLERLALAVRSYSER